MEEAEVRLVEVSAGLLEERPRAHHIRLHEFRRTLDRAVDVALRGEMHDGARLVLLQESAHEVAIADVAAHESMAGIAFHLAEILQAAGISELVERDNRLARERK